ncbi:MAG: hypothetical protein CMM30_00270 [Rhodospirillaceae bacterium]|nr:hypothetical protein [Alphaproteobacteria bacterium]MBR71365.1 hypothetical protein [Rhodospirillaceae bacterium]|tara:strand:- start:307 stop:876 length:570 start_codon:yes stop_codon:yes gene_type:complete
MPEPLLKKIEEANMDPELAAKYRKIRDLQEKKGGDATLFEVGANAPELMKWYGDQFYETIFYGGRVDVATKELLRFRLSNIHGCAFCNKGNIEDARSAGITEEKLINIMNEDSDVFSSKERAVLKLASEVVFSNMSGTLDKELYSDLSKDFDDGQIFELGMVAGFLTGMAKFLFTFDLVEKEANCPIKI